MELCDLHTHSKISDGTDLPEEIIELALQAGLTAVALCDHNDVGGLPAFWAAAEGKPIRAISGAEFSVDWKGRELHLLGLFIPENAFDRVTQLMEVAQERKRQSNVLLIESLQRAGYDIDFETVLKTTLGKGFNRAHVAQVLMSKGYVASIDEAIKTVLSDKSGHYRPPERFTFWEILEFIQEIGAVPVLAHPLLNLTETQLRELLPEAKKRGLAGMECLYSEYDEETTALAFRLAKEFDLLPSGGSDHHGERKPHIRVGVGRGNLQIPYAYALALEAIKTNSGAKAFL